MELTRGRVLPADTEATRLDVRAPAAVRGRVIPPDAMAALERARATLAAAEAEARALREEARRASADARLAAELEGRAEGASAVAALILALQARDARADEDALERSVALARVLAERLLGEALRVDPSRVEALARQALAEARGARQATVHAHPEDVAHLGSLSAASGLAVHVVPDATLARGALRLETDLGVLEAELAPQLERLARHLRELLGAPTGPGAGGELAGSRNLR